MLDLRSSAASMFDLNFLGVADSMAMKVEDSRRKVVSGVWESIAVVAWETRAAQSISVF